MTARRSFAAASALLVASLVAASAAAQAPGIDEVNVVGVREGGVIDAPPSSTTRIGEEETRRAAAYDVAELLQRVPGVVARQDTGAGQRLDISVRGLDAGRSRRTLVLEDGIPIALHPYAEPDLAYTTPIERVRAIEVTKGVASLREGPTTLGGVVDLRTPEPPTHRTTTVDLLGGDRGYRRMVARHGDIAGRLSFVSQASYQQGDGFRGQDFAKIDAAQKLRFTDARTVTTLSLGLHHDDDAADAVGLTRDIYVANPRTRSVSPNDRLRLRRLSASVVVERALSTASTLRATLFAASTARLWRRQSYGRSPAGDGVHDRVVGDPSIPGGAIYFLPTDVVLDRSYEVLGLEPRLATRFATGTLVHAIAVGARVLLEDGEQAVRNGASPLAFDGRTTSAERHRTTGLSAFVEDRLGVGQNLAATFAARFEHATFTRDVTRQPAVGGARDVALQGSSSVAALVPGVGLLAGTRDFQAFGDVYVGFAPPRLTSAVSPRGVAQASAVSAERSTQIELGIRRSIGALFRLETVGFGAFFRNQVVPAGGGDGTIEVDGGKTTRQGFESAGAVALGRALHLPLTADLRLRYTYLVATFSGGAQQGKDLPYAPRHTGGVVLELAREAAAVRFRATFAHAFFGAQFTDPANTIVEDPTGRVGRLPFRQIVDATLSAAPRQSGWSARLVVKNMFDDVSRLSRRPDGIFPAPGRQIMLGLAYTLEGPGPS